MKNIDLKTVTGFGREWSEFNYQNISDESLSYHFEEYFHLFPFNMLSNESSIGFDGGCGSGRWAKFVAPHCLRLLCIDASSEALEVAKTKLIDTENCEFFNSSLGELPMENESMDFGYSLGVIHHMPDPQSAINECRRVLKGGAPFLLYLYYKFDNRKTLYKYVWLCSNLLRLIICRLPFKLKLFICNVIAALVYFPFARLSKLLSFMAVDVTQLPLSYYKNSPFYILKNDALDRFGTRLEKRFTKVEIQDMLEKAGFHRILFSESHPYWCAISFAR